MILVWVVALGTIGYVIGHSLSAWGGVVGASIGAFVALATVRSAKRQPLRRRRARAEVRSQAMDGLASYKGLYRELEIVGESYRQDELRRVWKDGSADRTHDAALVPEPDNPHDPNAVRVEVYGMHVGYLSRESATEYCERMAGQSCRVPDTFGEGWR